MMTWFGGVPWVPSAERVNPRTMTIRVNAVTMMSAAGTRLTTPRSTTRASGDDSRPLFLLRSTLSGDGVEVVDVVLEELPVEPAAGDAAGATGAIVATGGMVSGAAAAAEATPLHPRTSSSAAQPATSQVRTRRAPGALRDGRLGRWGSTDSPRSGGGRHPCGRAGACAYAYGDAGATGGGSRIHPLPPGWARGTVAEPRGAALPGGSRSA